MGAAAGAMALAMLGGVITAVAGDAQALRAWTLLAVAPVIEEVVFRAGLQEALLRRPGLRAWATPLTALAFALAHLPAHGALWAMATAGPALLVGAVYARTRRLAPCVALHAGMNGAWLAATGLV